MAPKSGSARHSGTDSRFSLRRLLVTIHLVLGLSAGLLLSLTGLSGSVLVFRHEIDRWLEPGLRQVSPGPRGHVSLEQVVTSAARVVPGSAIQQIFLAESPGDSHELWLRGTDRRLYVDPYSARVLGGKRETETFTGWLFSWHTKLLSGETGERIVGWGGVILLLLSVSGVILWWPDRLRQVPDRLRIKWNASRKRVTYDLHRTGGFYAAALLALLALTGSSLVFDDWFTAAAFRITGTPPPGARPKAPNARSDARPVPLPLLLERVDNALPGGKLRRISFPAKAGGPVVVRKRMPGDLHPNGMSYVYVDPYRGNVLRVDRAMDASAGQRLVNLRYPLHIGRWGGFASRLLQSLAGLMPLVLFVTGCRMWWGRVLRFEAKRRSVRNLS
jgi:uncharacterized iron-regulated membrane protein